MTISEYLNSGNLIMTDEQAATYTYLGVSKRDLVQNTLNQFFGMRELFSQNINAALIADIQLSVKTLFDIHNYNWTKKYSTITIDYDPLTPTSYTDNNTETHSGADTISGSSSATGSNTATPAETETTQKNTFDNGTLTDTEKITKGGSTTASDSAETNDTHTNTYGHVIANNHTITGRDNLNYQEMIKRERDIAEYNFYEMIASEVADIISFANYDFETDNHATDYFFI